VDPAAETLAISPTLGQALAAERERQGLSRTEVAQRLHMSQWQIEALEASDYARLPQGTFLRGFVRNYAKVLGMQAESMLAQLAETAPRGPAPGIVVPSQNIRFDPLGERLSNPYVKAGGLAVVFISLGFAVMYWWFFIRPSPPAMSRKEVAPVAQNIAAAPVPPPEPVLAAPLEPPKVESPKVEPPKADLPKVESPRKVAQPRAEPVKAIATAPAETPRTLAGPNDHTVKLRFRGESWVEIKDRSGRVLLSRVNTRGSEAEVSGRPPFAIVIGNAPDVQLTYDDREFPLEPHTRVAVARFTLE
jgi:cytoskeleton protein RodZ